MLARYVDWLVALVGGDMGVSYQYRLPVARLIASLMLATANA